MTPDLYMSISFFTILLGVVVSFSVFFTVRGADLEDFRIGSFIAIAIGLLWPLALLIATALLFSYVIKKLPKKN